MLDILTTISNSCNFKKFITIWRMHVPHYYPFYFEHFALR